MSILGDFQRLNKTLFCGTSWSEEQLKLLSDSVVIYNIEGSYKVKEVLALDSITNVKVLSDNLFEVQYSFQGKAKTITWRCKDAKVPVKAIKRAIGDEVSIDLPVVAPLAATKFSKTIKFSQQDLEPKKEPIKEPIKEPVKEPIKEPKEEPKREPLLTRKESRVKNPTRLFVALGCAFQLRQKAVFDILDIEVHATRLKRAAVLEKYISLRHRSVCEKTINLIVSNHAAIEEKRRAAVIALGRISSHVMRFQASIAIHRWKGVCIDSSFVVSENLWMLNERNFQLVDQHILIKGLDCISKLPQRNLAHALRVLSNSRPTRLGPTHVAIVPTPDRVEATDVRILIPSRLQDDAIELQSNGSSASSSRKGSISSSVRNLFSLKSNK